MPVKGQSFIATYMAWDDNNMVGKTGDAGNHILRIVRDGQEVIPANSPAEVDSVNCPGLYRLSLTPTEMNGNAVVISGKSSSFAVSIVPMQLLTY